MKSIFAMTVLFLFSYVVPAAAQNTSLEEVKQNTSEAVSSAMTYTKEQRDEFQKDMKSKLSDIKKELAEMKAESAKKNAAVKKEMRTEITQLEGKTKEMNKSLAKLEKSSGKAWNEMKDGMGKSWDELSASYEAAKDKFKDEK